MMNGVEYLQKKGFTIQERNFRAGGGEIDIIAQKEDILAVIEVKTRSHRFFGEPQEFVKKQIN